LVTVTSSTSLSLEPYVARALALTDHPRRLSDEVDSATLPIRPLRRLPSEELDTFTIKQTLR
jgi:hypothetical protein